MEQNPKKSKLAAVRSAWPVARELLWAKRGRLGLGLLLLVVSRLASMVLPASTKYLIDEVIGKQRVDLLPWIAGAAAVATVIGAVTSFGLTLLLGVAAQKTISEWRLKVQEHVMRLKVSYFDNHKSGELISRVMNDAEGIRNLVGTGFVQLIGGSFTAVVALGVLFWLNWRLTAVTIVLFAAFAGIMAVGFSRLRPIFRERNKIQAEVTGRLTEALGGIRVVKAYTAEKHEERVFAHNVHRLLRNIASTMVGVSGITAGSSLLFGLTGTGMAFVGGHEVLAGRMTLGDLFMFVIFTGLVVTPMIQISSIGTQITEAFAGLDRINEILSEPAESPRDGIRLGRLEGRIEFHDVRFTYSTGDEVLKGLSFAARPGTTVALVGPSGAGKSTVIRLVMAFDRPTAGSITVDGHDLGDVALADYRGQLGIVLQESFLFDGTVAENIGYSRPGATREEIVEAAKIAHCDDFVTALPDGYDTVIGERGVKLSGGQRQRLSIARAILADPRVLILDEATSSLDSDSEEKIQAGLAGLLRGRTTFVIAHRLSTIRNAELILVMDEGKIVEHGRHEDLLALDGIYRRLHDKQFRIEQNRYVNPGEVVEIYEG
jgi:subfamily B ATP-binding cassette protein MsbA